MMTLAATLVLTWSVLAAPNAPGPAVGEPPGRLLPRQVTPETDAAIRRGLDYLARNQEREGSWRNRTGYGAYPVAMSALAGLAFLASGSTTTQGAYGPQVDRVTDYLLSSATESGLITREDQAEGRSMYGHGYSMLFLGELYGMTEDPGRQARIHEVLSRAIGLTDRAQSPLGGWIYQPDQNSDEGSVTITQLQGLRSCRNAGIAVPKSVIDRALRYLELSFRSDGGIAYRAQMAGPSRPPITAAAVCCWYNAGDYDNRMAKRALQFCQDNITAKNVSGGYYFYAHLYYSQAVYLSGDAKLWEEYYPAIRDHLLKLQEADGSWMGDNVGYIYGTSVALIVLQLPYNRLPIMQR